MSIQNLSSAEIVKFHQTGHTATSSEKSSLFGEDGFTFGDILDVINPLQHIPVINMIYRKLTGDTIAPAMQIAGDALFGGPIGAAISMVTTTIKSQFNREDTEPEQTTIDASAIASNTSQNLPQAIGANDYSKVSDLKIDPSTQTYQQTERAIIRPDSVPVGPIISMDTPKNEKYNGTDKYNEIISATEPSVKNVDVIIGAGVDAG